ncbi:hypothetical protein [Luteimonas sp. A478]
MSSPRDPHSSQVDPGKPPRQSGLQEHWRWIAGGAALLLIALLVLRQPLAERLWPQNSAQDALRQAGAALQRGHLSDPEGSGARELYEAALAMDPDRPEPRQGLAAVAHAAVEQAQRETAAGRYPEAHAALKLARELSAPREAVQSAAEALRKREAAGAGLEQLWANAERAHEAGRLYGNEDSALPLYSRILRLDSEHLGALRGRDDGVAELLQQARAALRSGELAEAAAMIAVAAEFDPGHVDLPDTRARLTEERDATLAQAAADLDAGQLERAAQRYRALLEMDPSDEQASDGLVQTGVAHARRAVRLAADFRFADADAALAQARELAPIDAQVRSLAERVDAARTRQAQLDPAHSPAERRELVASLLAEAAAAQSRGDLLSPPGENAFDKLRAARSLAPDDPQVREASEQLLAAATGCFERELRANSLGRANACLDVRVALADDSGDLIAARRRLAQRWLAIGDERLGAGDLPGAGAALESARTIDPSVSGLAEFAQRLRTASASPSR